MEGQDAFASRIRGALLASACANSLGGASLGMNRREIMLAVGLHGIRDFVGGLSHSINKELQPGSLLSDTHLALVVAESLLSNKGKLDESDLKERFAGLLENPDFLSGCPGAHCLLPLRLALENLSGHDETLTDNTHVSAACRAYPVGLLPEHNSVVNIAVEQARLSHPDTRVWAAAAVLAHSVSSFIHGLRLDNAQAVRQYVQQEFDIASKIDPRFAESWDDVAPDLDYENPASELPYSLINVDSHVNESVPTAVGIFLIFRHDLEEAIASAAAAGGDTDTVAAIVGALSGAYHGVEAIPERWLKGISQRDRLEQIAEGFINLWQ